MEKKWNFAIGYGLGVWVDRNFFSLKVFGWNLLEGDMH